MFSPIFGAFVGWLILVYLGLEGLGVFVVLVCVCFSFVQVLLLFVSASFLFCCWIAVGVVLVFLCFVFLLILFSFIFFVFVFCFKGQVRWPKGPPHLALNPPYFIFFVVCYVFGFPVFAFN